MHAYGLLFNRIAIFYHTILISNPAFSAETEEGDIYVPSSPNVVVIKISFQSEDFREIPVLTAFFGDPNSLFPNSSASCKLFSKATASFVLCK